MYFGLRAQPLRAKSFLQPNSDALNCLNQYGCLCLSHMKQLLSRSVCKLTCMILNSNEHSVGVIFMYQPWFLPVELHIYLMEPRTKGSLTVTLGPRSRKGRAITQKMFSGRTYTFKQNSPTTFFPSIPWAVVVCFTLETNKSITAQSNLSC